MRPPARLIPALLLALTAPVLAADPGGPAPARLGLDASPGWLEAEASTAGLGSTAGEAPLHLRLPLAAAHLAEPDRVAARLQQMESAGVDPLLLLLSPPALEAGDLSGLEPWLAAVDRLLQSRGGRPLRMQVFRQVPAAMTPAIYGYVLKRAAVAIRAAAPGSMVATAELGDADMAAALAGEGVGPYLDAVILGPPALAGNGLAATRHALPRAEIWLVGAGASGRPFIQEAAAALAAGAAVVLADAGAAPTGPVLRAWSRLLSADSFLVPPAFRRVEATQGGVPLAADQLAELERSDGERYVVVFAPPAPEPLTLTVRGPRVSVGWLRDPVSGEEVFGASADWLVAGGDPASAGISRLQLKAPERPLLLRLGRVGAFPPPSTQEEVRGSRGLTVEEILARHREVQAGQDRRLATLEADVRIDYRFSVATLDQTFDVTTHNRFYHDGERAIYEEKDLYVNGALWTGQRHPDLPFVLPDRVTEVPLDLRLDDRYRYRLERQEALAGDPVYVVAFEPAPDSDAPYSGRVWIDTLSFVKRRMEVVELLPRLPVVSNRLVQEFTPVAVEGRTWWLMTRLVGQMVFTALGRNVLLERDLIYTDYRVNDAEFDRRLQQSYDSQQPILEETADGFRRLTTEPGPGGSSVRRVNAELGRQGVSRLLVAGWSIGDELDFGFPFAGVNYFNFDWRGTGTQLDVAWAGPFLNVVWSDPSLGGSRAILSVEGRILPLYSTNRRIDYQQMLKDDVRAERLQESRQVSTVALGYPVGTYQRLEARMGLDLVRFKRDDDMADDFIVPTDTWEGTVAAAWNWSRLGWRLDGELAAGKRRGWRFWGSPDGSDYDDGDDTFTRGLLVFNKTFYRTARADKFGFRVSLYDGNGLDRFSRFGMGNFGAARVPGYSGDGILFDTGGVLDLNASLDTGARTRLDLSISHGRFRNEEDLGPHVQHASGASASLTFAGPFSSLMRVRLAAGLGSSIPEADGGADLRVTFFRTFSRWFWQKKAPVVESGAQKKAPEPEAGAGAVP